MKKTILLLVFLIITVVVLYSCFFNSTNVYAPVMIEFDAPDNAELTVRDIRVKGFTLDWTDVPSGEYGCEYAVAVSHTGNIEDYDTALENDKIVLDFTPDYILNRTYKVTNLVPGKEYEIKLFVRAKNIKACEYLTAEAVLPYIDDAELMGVRINGHEAIYDKTDDSYSYYYLPGQEEEKEAEYTFTYNLMRGCDLYINGAKTEETAIKLTPDEPLEVTAVNSRTQAARDYVIYAGGRDNGLPIVIIDTTNGRSIRSQDRNVEAQMTIIDSKNNPLGIGLYDGSIAIRGRGNSSWGMPKKGYNFEMSEKSQILDMAPSRDWLLMANYADKSLMRNYIAYEFARDLGAAFAPKMRFVDLILNGEYMGNYIIGERVRVGEGRLDFPKLSADMTDEYELTGTYVLEINCSDRLDGSEITFHSSKISEGHTTVWGRAEGDTVVIRQPGEQNLPKGAYEYIKDYFNAAEDALFGDNFKDPKKGYRAYIDTASFVDWYLLNEFYKNVDADFRLSTFLYKPRGGKLHMGPIWDCDLGAGNADYRSCDDPKGWYVRTSIWHERLFEDEAFAQEVKDRFNYLKDNGYFDVLFKRIDETAEMLEKSAEMNFEKWDILGEYVWPNANNFWERTTYQSEVEYFKDWLTRRFEWMDYEINTERISAAEQTAADKAKYPNVRFGETSDILLLEVEWHTKETYEEYIEEYKKTLSELPDDIKEQNEQYIKYMEENIKLIDRNRYYESRLINGKNRGGIINLRADRRINISQYFDKDGYYVYKIYPYNIYVVYNDENGEFQYKSFGTANSRQEYEYALNKEIIPFCDGLLEKGLMTQEQYDLYTVKDLLNLFIERLFE